MTSDTPTLQAQGNQGTRNVNFPLETLNENGPLKHKSLRMTRRDSSSEIATFRDKARSKGHDVNMTERRNPREPTRFQPTPRSKMDVERGIEESGDESETSTSSSTASSCRLESPTTCVTRSLSLSATERWKKHVQIWNVPPETHDELQPLLLPSHRPDVQPSGLVHDTSISLGPHVKTQVAKLLTLAYPVTFTYVLEFLPVIVSMMLVGHLDSRVTKQYVDAVTLSSMCMNLTAIGVGFGLATALDTLCAQAYGAGKLTKLGIYLQSGCLVLGLALVPVCLVNWYTEALLVSMGQPPHVAQFAGRFSRILLPGIPAIYVYEMVKKVLQAQNVVVPMVYIAILSNLVHALVGVYLTFFTSWGFEGAAIARVVSALVLPLCLLPYFLHHPPTWWPGWQVHEARQHVGLFLRLGLPGAAMLLLEWWSFEMMAAFVGFLPNRIVALSVHSVLVNVSTLAFNCFLGIGVAANVLVGNYLGRHQPEHAKVAAGVGMLVSVSFSALLALVVVSTRSVVPQLFINDARSIEQAAHALVVLVPYQLCDALNAVMQGIFRGTARLTLGAWINFVAYFVIGLPCGLVLAFRLHWGVEGMWMGLTLGIFLGCVVSFVKIYETKWRNMADAARVRTTS